MRVLIGLFLILFLPSPVMGQSDYGEYGGAILVNIYDAKTFVMNLPEYPPLIGEMITVKIGGIETPKLKGKCKRESQLAAKAKKFTEKALKNAELIDLTNMKRGKFFKIIADILVNDEDFAGRLVEKGYAVKIKKKTHNWCK
jgi:micrococcal nuclease